MAGLVKRRVTRPASNLKERASAAIPAVNKAPAMPAAAAQELKIGFLIHDVSRLRRTMFDQMMKPYGVTRAQWWVIAHLSRKDGMTQTQLAAMLDITKVTLGGNHRSSRSGRLGPS